MRINLNVSLATLAARVARMARVGARLVPILLLTAMFAAPAYAVTTYVSRKDGNWSSDNTWTVDGTNCNANHSGCSVPGWGDSVVISSGDVVNLDVNSPLVVSLVINGSGKLTGTSGKDLRVIDITNNNSAADSLALDGRIITGGGRWTSAGAGSWTLKSIQLEGGSVRFNSSDNFTIKLTGATPIDGYGYINDDAANKTITFNYSGGDQTVMTSRGSITIIYPNLTLSNGGTKTPSTYPSAFNPDGTLTYNANFTLDVRGDLFVSTGTIFAGDRYNPVVNLYGNLTHGVATFSAGSSLWTFMGTRTQSVSGATTFARATINNSSGVSPGVDLLSDVTVSGALTLSQGVVRTSGNVLTSGADCSSGVARSGGYVDGNLRYTFPNPSANVTCTYHVGSNGWYAPLGLVVNSSGGLTLTASTSTGSHPQIASSGINSALDVNRYWSLWHSGDTLLISSYAATFNFASGDVDSGANWANFVLRKYAASTWTALASVSPSATAIGASNVTDPLNASTDFSAGEAAQAPAACSVPAGFATCLCDSFNRSSLNPSPIYNNDWAVGHSNGTFGDPVIVAGRLRLTSALTNISTVATLPGMFPAAGNKIMVEFLQYAYGGSSPGADGMALTLSDASVPPAAGAYGGSLGYAQKTGISGFAGGWLGVGFDEYGNYATNGEGRVGGNASGVSQAVSLRGSASSSYLLLNTSGSVQSTSGYLSPGIDGNSAGRLYRVTVDATNYTWNGSTGNKFTAVKVERNTTGTYAALPNLDLPNIYTYNSAQNVVPQNWKLSFTGSTGSSTNIHEISALKVCSTLFTAPGSFTIESSTASGLSCATPGGTVAPPVITVTARDSLGVLNAAYRGTVTLRARVAGVNSGTATWYDKNGVIVPGGTYTYTAADAGVAQFYLVDSASETVTLTVSDAQASSTAAAPVVFTSAASIKIDYAASNPPVVAGLPLLLKATYLANGCSGASGTAVSRDMSGWYVPNSADPGGIAPRFCRPYGSGASASCFPPSGSLTCTSPLSTSTPPSSNLTLDFDTSSAAYFCLVSSDVGKYQAMWSLSATPATTTSSTPILTLPPFAVAVSDVRSVVATPRTAAGTVNPAGVANNGTAFTSAGSAFQATVGGYLWNAAADLNKDGLPDAGATLSQVTDAGVAPHYTDTVLLSALAATPALNPGLTNGNVLINGGSATTTALRYGEVGAFTLGATAAVNYLGVLDLNSRVVYFTAGSNQTANPVIGRFFPDHFALTASSVGYGCGSGATGFTYQGQPFGVDFTIEAQNAANVRTASYGAAGYAPQANAAPGLVAENADNGTDLAARLTAISAVGAASVRWDGSASGTRAASQLGQFRYFNGAYGFTRAAAAEAPFATLALGVTLADNSGDLVALTGLNMRATMAGDCAAAGNCDAVRLAMSDGGTSTSMRWGRMRIDNAYGSERLPLKVNLEAQFWNGNAFVRNTLDGVGNLPESHCTSLAAAQFAALAAGSGAAITTFIVDPAPITWLTAGVGAIRLAQPSNSPLKTGSVVLSTGAPLSNFLPGSGRETFGVYKSGPVIYIREMF